MIGYICRYAPIEVLEGFGVNAVKIKLEADASGLNSKICSCAAAVQKAVQEGGYDAVVLTDCCEALAKVADSLEQDGKKVYRLKLPKTTSAEAANQYAKEIKSFIQKFAIDSKRGFDMEKFVAAVAVNARKDIGEHIALTGACPPEWIKTIFDIDSSLPVVDYSCAQSERFFDDVNSRGEDGKAVIDWYAEQLLNQVPHICAENAQIRMTRLYSQGVRGMLRHISSNCDFCETELADAETGVPVMELQTEGFGSANPKKMADVRRFLEQNGWLGGAKEQGQSNVSEKDRYYVGIDSGSCTTNAVILDGRGNIVAKGTLSTGSKCRQSAKLVVEVLLKQNGIDKKDVKFTVATGYGRNVLSEVDKDITEISCHAKGAKHLFPNVSTVIDVGGHDCKVTKLDASGNVTDFLMNDKCAAGTGRFLEIMAGKLGLTIADFAQKGLEWQKEVVISSMCAVFAESEVISLIGGGTAVSDILHGINKSVANRLLGMILQQNCHTAYVMTGGVAQNKGIVKELSNRLGEEVLVSDEPNITGALGAALFALEEGQALKK